MGWEKRRAFLKDERIQLSSSPFHSLHMSVSLRLLELDEAGSMSPADAKFLKFSLGQFAICFELIGFVSTRCCTAVCSAKSG